MHLDDGMAREQGVAKAFRNGLSRPVPCRAERALIAIERRENDRCPCFQCDAGWVREFLQRNDIGVQLGDDGRDAIRIVTPVSPHTRVHVVSRDSKRRRRAHYPNSARSRWPETADAN
jgi:hypothetical protein